MRFKRILLKLSGEVLAGQHDLGIEQEAIFGYAEQVAEIAKSGVEVGVVLGGGNFWRARMAPYMERNSADSMGMLATIMNGLAFASISVPLRTTSASICKPRKAAPESVVKYGLPVPPTKITTFLDAKCSRAALALKS